MNFFEIRDRFADNLCDFLREKDENALQKLDAVIKAILYGKAEAPEKVREELLSEFPLLTEDKGFILFDLSQVDPFTEIYLKEKAKRYENFLKGLGDFEPVGEDIEKNVLMAKELFRAGLFFEVHEILEHVWMVEFGSVREFLQALIQLGAACYHLENYNEKGYRQLLENALELLQRYSGVLYGIDIAELRSKIKMALEGRFDATKLL
ncbi:DUF309 domain-containing protein [Phorcysia thermohydrogeniphila]|uniref:DUF309 domain-containing protein n=1 Tax=Phorcysia thermohydrogeniphila TaxID=936138 RepID=A0A4R1G7D0_9BACT|nr:DUF309 domain-containing protein [Phorcysia thermohydrogeniphila]TCK03967.1 hypothetical protein CLV27_1284 [Phorcysia thermohydrogeniphila]